MVAVFLQYDADNDETICQTEFTAFYGDTFNTDAGYEDAAVAMHEQYDSDADGGLEMWDWTELYAAEVGSN